MLKTIQFKSRYFFSGSDCLSTVPKGDSTVGALPNHLRIHLTNEKRDQLQDKKFRGRRTIFNRLSSIL